MHCCAVLALPPQRKSYSFRFGTRQSRLVERDPAFSQCCGYCLRDIIIGFAIATSSYVKWSQRIGRGTMVSRCRKFTALESPKEITISNPSGFATLWSDIVCRWKRSNMLEREYPLVQWMTPFNYERMPGGKNVVHCERRSLLQCSNYCKSSVNQLDKIGG